MKCAAAAPQGGKPNLPCVDAFDSIKSRVDLHALCVVSFMQDLSVKPSGQEMIEMGKWESARCVRPPQAATAIAFNAWCADEAIADSLESTDPAFTKNKRPSVLPAPFPLARSAGAPHTSPAPLRPPSASIKVA